MATIITDKIYISIPKARAGQALQIGNAFLLSLIFLLPGCFSPARSAPSIEETQNAKVPISGIYYFGYQGLDLDKIKETVPLKINDKVDTMSLLQKRDQYFKDTIDLVGKPLTDVALVSTLNGSVLFIGLPGKSNSEMLTYLPVGKKRVSPPAEIAKTYREYMAKLTPYLQAPDQKKKLEMKSLQEQMKQQSISKRAELRRSLLESSDGLDRGVAAYALGLVAMEPADFEALTRAANDSSSLVRNNATRELGELIQAKPELAAKVPAHAIETYVDMINSRTWTDRNKAIFMVIDLTKTRNQKVLALLKAKALPSLREMCLWPEGYAQPALQLIGRIGGIPATELDKMVEQNKTDEILKSVSVPL